jgi:RNA-directed DNA polymerase
VRYADDFVVLCNGTRGQAEELKQELKIFLKEELCLTLSEEKTKITHLNKGCKFLGFWIQRKQGHDGMKTKVLIPQEAVRTIKEKIAHITDTSTYGNAMNAEIAALNRVIGGWCRYYQYTSWAGTVFGKIDRYAFWRLAHWIGRKYNISILKVMERYREDNTLATDEYTLIRAASLGTRQYKKRFLKPNPYMEQTDMRREELPSATYWTGQETRPGAMDLRQCILKRDNYTCQICGTRDRQDRLQVDHKRPVRRFKDLQHADDLDNLWTLCMSCHKEKTKADR